MASWGPHGNCHTATDLSSTCHIRQNTFISPPTSQKALFLPCFIKVAPHMDLVRVASRLYLARPRSPQLCSICIASFFTCSHADLQRSVLGVAVLTATRKYMNIHLDCRSDQYILVPSADNLVPRLGGFIIGCEAHD